MILLFAHEKGTRQETSTIYAHFKSRYDFYNKDANNKAVKANTRAVG
jgi:hypothetical protein